ncbi:MAG: Nucleoside-diphosphate-sugar epimerase [Labilithrix sp.]|nr:Nucleoside-diphosphate-sugar epimerase [Labilithrix sp.]
MSSEPVEDVRPALLGSVLVLPAVNRGIVSEMIDEVLVLGAGYAGRAVLALARERGLVTNAVVRSAARAEGLQDHAVVVAPVFDAALATLAGPSTHVVVTFPPDGATDARVSFHAGAITYVSTTGVYGDRRGVVDDQTPVTETPTASIALRLEAEEIWRRRGATILRCPAIYGADRGLHVRVVRGQHKIPGDGSGYVSRIHVEDLAALILAAPRAPGDTFVVGDAKPARHADVVRWICAAYGVPMPPSVPLSEVHETLRGDRCVDGSRALRVLGVTLRYPTYEVGYHPDARAT